MVVHMKAVLISGSPAHSSKTAGVLAVIAQALKQQGVQVQTLRVTQLPPTALLHADFADPAIQQAQALVRGSDVVVVATPGYKASMAGVLKAFLDLLPERALEGKWVWSVATAGSAHHLLALDYALRPVLSVLGAGRSLPNLFVQESHCSHDAQGQLVLDASIHQRIGCSVQELLGEARVAHAALAPLAQAA